MCFMFSRVFNLADNGWRVGDVALCCACGRAILLTRCYSTFLIISFPIYAMSYTTPWVFHVAFVTRN